MNSRFFLFSFFILFLFTYGYSANINYELITNSSAPYYSGTLINDLKITFIDNNSIINYSLDYLNIKIGNEKYTLNKSSDNSYHYRNFILTNNNIIDNKIIIQILNPLEGQYSNIKQTYMSGNISDIITIKSNPEKEYSKMTIGEPIKFILTFDDLKKENISNMNCYLDALNSENKFECTKNECNYDIIAEDKNYEILCNFDKLINNTKKTYPLYFKIIPEISEGLIIGKTTNPKDNKINNPFEVCFELLYKSQNKVVDLTNIIIKINDSTKDIYLRNESLCYSKFLIPFTELNDNIIVEYLNEEYEFKINSKLKSGTYWNIFFIVFGIIILINLVLLFKALFIKETIEDLTQQRDNYKNKLKNIKEDYLQGKITKKEFDNKLNEYSIKISYLNEKLINTKPKEFNAKIMPKQMTTETKNTKANADLLNIINGNNQDNKTQEINTKKDDELIFVNDNDIKSNQYTSISEEIENSTINTNLKQKESKIISFLKNLFKRKLKDKDENKQKQQKEEIDIKEINKKDLDIKVNDEINYTNQEDNFDIKSWQK